MKSIPPLIRIATLEDFPHIFSMMQHLKSQEMDRNRLWDVYQFNISNANIVYAVWEKEAVPLGFISVYFQQLLHHSGWVAEIQELFVAAECRSQGIGAALIGFAKDIALQKGCVLMEVATSQRRKMAHEFYERCGFDCSHFKFTYTLAH